MTINEIRKLNDFLSNIINNVNTTRKYSDKISIIKIIKDDNYNYETVIYANEDIPEYLMKVCIANESDGTTYIEDISLVKKVEKVIIEYKEF